MNIVSKWMTGGLCLLTAGFAVAEDKNYDIVIYGGSGGGVAAAIEAARQGKSAVLIDPNHRIGGMTTSGLGATDIGNKSSVSGLAREFYHRVWKYYQNPEAWTHETREEYLPKHPDAISESLETQWFFEPKVAEQVLNEMLQESGAQVVKGKRLDRNNGVVMDGNRIVSIRTEDGEVFRGKMFVDASYEGDLMADAGVTYFVGREPNDQYGEFLNGIVPNQPVFSAGISPFKVEGKPESGLLEGVDPQSPGEAGEGDHRVQAYTFRVCLTDVPENMIPIEKPENYNPELFETHLRYAVLNPEAVPGKAFFKLTPMPNRKTDSNNRGSFSTDFVGMSEKWAEASYAEREALWQAHFDYVKGLIWFLGNDPRVPEPIRAETLRWGLPKDEFQDTANWPFQLYVREARRMISDYVVTENDCRRYVLPEDAVILASYPMDSHFTSRYVDEEGRLRVEGGMMTKVDPYPVSYRSIVPKKEECANLFVPVCLSASHAAYGSIRMEPVFMMLGQVAALAATDAIDKEIAVQEVSTSELVDKLNTREALQGIKQESLETAPPKLSNPERELNLAEFRDAVAKLHEQGIIKDADYWYTNARPGNPFDGGHVGEVLIAYAATKESVDSLPAALEILTRENIVHNAKGYWNNQALTGKKCAIGVVGPLFIKLAGSLP